jgi:DNA polymerase V
MYVGAGHVLPKDEVPENVPMQLDMFTDYHAEQQKRLRNKALLEKEQRQQHAVLDIKKRFGKNAILKGMNYLEGATARDRNAQIGGHKA